jgi:hypothetical protein
MTEREKHLIKEQDKRDRRSNPLRISMQSLWYKQT